MSCLLSACFYLNNNDKIIFILFGSKRAKKITTTNVSLKRYLGDYILTIDLQIFRYQAYYIH